MSNPLHKPSALAVSSKTSEKDVERISKRVSTQSGDLKCVEKVEEEILQIKLSRDPIFYDSLNVNFNAYVFLHQLFMHIFLPFSIFLSPNPEIQGFYTRHPMFLFYHYLVPIVFIIMIVIYFIEVGRHHTDSYPLQYCWIFPTMAWLLHKILISLKYASMSDTEYRRYFTATMEFYPHYIKQTQLLSAWQDLSKEDSQQILNFEVVTAGLRCNRVVNDIYLYLDNPQEDRESKSHYLRWMAFLANAEGVVRNGDKSKFMQAMGDGSYRIPLICVIKSIIVSVEKKNATLRKNILHGSNIVSLVNIIIPIAEYIKSCTSDRSLVTALSILFLVMSSLINFWYYDVLMKFTLTAITDTLRRKDFLIMSKELLRLSDLMTESGVSASENISTSIIKTGSAIMSVKEAKDVNANRDMAFITELLDCIIDQQDNLCGERYQNNNELATIIHHHVYEEGENIEKLPIITMHDSRNVISWTHMQHIFINFGARYKHRLDSLVQVVLFYGALLFAGAITAVYTDSRGMMAAFSSAFFYQAFVTISFYLLFLVFLVSASVTVTESRSKSRLILINHAMKCTEEILQIQNKPHISERDRAEISRLQVLYETITSCDDSISKGIEISPYLTLSMPATPAMLSSVISAVTSFYITIFSIFIKAATTS